MNKNPLKEIAGRIFIFFLGVFPGLIAINAVFEKKIPMGKGNFFYNMTMAKDPLDFWGMVAALLVISAILFYMAFTIKFQEDNKTNKKNSTD